MLLRLKLWISGNHSMLPVFPNNVNPYTGLFVGTALFSFHPSKYVGAYGRPYRTRKYNKDPIRCRWDTIRNADLH